MRLLPMKEPDRSWRSIKGQWKKDAESVGEDFSTFSTGIFSAYDGLTKDGDNPNLYCLSDGERVHAACQVSRLMMSKYPIPSCVRASLWCRRSTNWGSRTPANMPR